MRPKTAKGIYLIVLVVGLIVTLIGGLIFHSNAVIWTGGGILIAGIIFHMIFYRCPACGRHLGRNNGEFCQHCGASLFEEEK